MLTQEYVKVWEVQDLINWVLCTYSTLAPTSYDFFRMRRFDSEHYANNWMTSIEHHLTRTNRRSSNTSLGEEDVERSLSNCHRDGEDLAKVSLCAYQNVLI